MRKSAEFVRDGNDIISNETISFTQAALGASIRVRTLDGTVDLKIPAGTQNNTVFRIRDKGVPVLGSRNRRGDHHVRVQIAVPKKLTPKQKELLQAFAAACGESTTEESAATPENKARTDARTEKEKNKKGFWSKLKDEL